MEWVRHAVSAAVTVALAGLGPQARALDSLSLAQAYGAGVHAYFSGAYDRSYDDMTAVIEADADPRDPRPLYFRGLSALKLGRLDEAEADFSTGAKLEAESLGTFPVSTSLERVQGCDRLRLEQHRVRARVAFRQTDRDREDKRYSAIADKEPDVLRDKRPAAGGVDAANPFDAAPPRPTPAPEPAPEPMPEPGEAPVEEPSPPGGGLEPEPEPPATSDDPFMPAAPAEVPAAGEPSGVDAPVEPEPMVGDGEAGGQ